MVDIEHGLLDVFVAYSNPSMVVVCIVYLPPTVDWGHAEAWEYNENYDGCVDAALCWYEGYD